MPRCADADDACVRADVARSQVGYRPSVDGPHTFEFYAMRHIAPDEELLIHYGYEPEPVRHVTKLQDDDVPGVGRMAKGGKSSSKLPDFVKNVKGKLGPEMPGMPDDDTDDDDTPATDDDTDDDDTTDPTDPVGKLPGKMGMPGKLPGKMGKPGKLGMPAGKFPKSPVGKGPGSVHADHAATDAETDAGAPACPRLLR